MHVNDAATQHRRSVMTEILRLDIDGIPETKGSWRCTCASGKPRLYADNEREEGWALAIAWATRAKLRGKIAPTKARIAVRLEFTLPPRAGHQSYNRDLDKLMRSVLDALTGLVYVDDEQVDAAALIKRRGDKPGAIIIVETIE